MKLIMAPMEGITTYPLRNAFNQCFGGFDEYMSPFISPADKKPLKIKEAKDIEPENNKDIVLIPQVLTHKVKQFVKTAEALSEKGYSEVNLNLGCPSGTVTAKGRGSGMLKDPAELERFLDQVFETLAEKGEEDKIRISLKTRIGFWSKEEWEWLLTIYNRFPVKELTVHPRLAVDMYKGKPDLDAFRHAYEHAKMPLVYNGDIRSKEDYDRIVSEFPEISGIMIGRAVVSNPFLLEEIRTGNKVSFEDSKDKLKEYHDAVYSLYHESFQGNKNLLLRMKEFWVYLFASIQPDKRLQKELLKAKDFNEYEMAVRVLFS